MCQEIGLPRCMQQTLVVSGYIHYRIEGRPHLTVLVFCELWGDRSLILRQRLVYDKKQKVKESPTQGGQHKDTADWTSLNISEQL